MAETHDKPLGADGGFDLGAHIAGRYAESPGIIPRAGVVQRTRAAVAYGATRLPLLNEILMRWSPRDDYANRRFGGLLYLGGQKRGDVFGAHAHLFGNGLIQQKSRIVAPQINSPGTMPPVAPKATAKSVVRGSVSAASVSGAREDLASTGREVISAEPTGESVPASAPPAATSPKTEEARRTDGVGEDAALASIATSPGSREVSASEAFGRPRLVDHLMRYLLSGPVARTAVYREMARAPTLTTVDVPAAMEQTGPTVSYAMAAEGTTVPKQARSNVLAPVVVSTNRKSSTPPRQETIERCAAPVVSDSREAVHRRIDSGSNSGDVSRESNAASPLSRVAITSPGNGQTGSGIDRRRSSVIVTQKYPDGSPEVTVQKKSVTDAFATPASRLSGSSHVMSNNNRKRVIIQRSTSRPFAPGFEKASMPLRTAGSADTATQRQSLARTSFVASQIHRSIEEPSISVQQKTSSKSAVDNTPERRGSEVWTRSQTAESPSAGTAAASRESSNSIEFETMSTAAGVVRPSSRNASYASVVMPLRSSERILKRAARRERENPASALSSSHGTAPSVDRSTIPALMNKPSALPIAHPTLSGEISPMTAGVHAQRAISQAMSSAMEPPTIAPEKQLPMRPLMPTRISMARSAAPIAVGLSDGTPPQMRYQERSAALSSPDAKVVSVVNRAYLEPQGRIDASTVAGTRQGLFKPLPLVGVENHRESSTSSTHRSMVPSVAYSPRGTTVQRSPDTTSGATGSAASEGGWAVDSTESGGVAPSPLESLSQEALEKLADKVYDIIEQRLIEERESLGL